jgi:hypothetical protein
MGVRGIVHGLRARGDESGQSFITNRAFAVIGDSLTERAFASTPIYWQMGLLGAPLQLIANSGMQGRSILDVKNQIDNDYKLTTGAGFGGLPPLGLAGLRIGTNTVRGAPGSTGIAISSGNQSDYVSILNSMKGYAEHVIVFPVPPIGGSSIAKNTAVAGYNTYLQGLCSSDPRLHWLDDCTGLVDGSGNVLPQYFDSDELHMNGAGTLQMAITSQPAWEALLADLYGPSWRQSPLVTDAADVYPSTSQWVTNPTNVGETGTFGSGWAGTLPTGWRVETNGTGIGGSCSIVAADAGDPNQVPWVRISPSSSNTGSNISVSVTAAGTTISASVPDPLEQLLEVRGNSLTNFNDLTMWMQAGGQKLTPNARLRWGASIGLNVRGTLRQQHFRTGSTGGSPIIATYIAGAAVASGSMGSIDLRCWSIRG